MFCIENDDSTPRRIINSPYHNAELLLQEETEMVAELKKQSVYDMAINRSAIVTTSLLSRKLCPLGMVLAIVL